MKHTERITMATLAILAIFSIVAVILQLINTKTDALETSYEIITFSVAIVALTLTIIQGISNARTSRELKKIIKELGEVIALEKDIEKDITVTKKATDPTTTKK